MGYLDHGEAVEDDAVALLEAAVGGRVVGSVRVIGARLGVGWCGMVW